MTAFAAHQRSLPAQAVRIRIGVHFGEVSATHPDIVGSPVRLASWIASQAVGGEILASSVVREIVGSSDVITFGSPSERKRALADFTRLIELAPGSGARWASRADARGFLDDLPGAIEDYTRALALESNERYFKLRADVYVRRGRPGDEARALADLKEVVALARDSSDGADALAEIERIESRRR